MTPKLCEGAVVVFLLVGFVFSVFVDCVRIRASNNFCRIVFIYTRITTACAVKVVFDSKEEEIPMTAIIINTIALSINFLPSYWDSVRLLKDICVHYDRSKKVI